MFNNGEHFLCVVPVTRRRPSGGFVIVGLIIDSHVGVLATHP